MGKYCIVFLPSKEVSEYNQKLVDEVGPKFAETYLIDNPRPPHITLKSPFYMEDTSAMETALAKFVKKCKSAEVEVGGFGSFHSKVSYLKTEFSPEAMQIQKDLLKEILPFKEVYLKEFDSEFKPHITVAYGNTPEIFDNIWEYLQQLPQPKFKIKFDNVTLLKKVKNEWQIYKEFDINSKSQSGGSE